ncbi:MAG: hypothetical protein OEW08_02160 [Gammaproteobacteria bacterium]|nr:hypothetical protein [Gammaproteobacteria bacterium]
MTMSRIFLFFTIYLVSTIGHAAGVESLTKSGKLMEQKHYDEAWRELFFNLGTIEQAKRDDANMILGTILHNDAALYKRFYDDALTSQEAYLNLLLKDKSKKRSKYAQLASAALAYDMGNCKSANSYLKNANLDGQNMQYTAVKDVLSSICLNNKNPKVAELISKASSNIDALALAMKAGLSSGQSKAVDEHLSKSGITTERVLKEANALGISSYITVLTKQGKIEEALKLVAQAELNRYWLKEESKEGRVIYFYTPSLLASLSDLYAAASKHFMDKVDKTGKFAVNAKYVLYERAFFEGDYTTATGLLSEILGKQKLPPRAEQRAATAMKLMQEKVRKGGNTAKVASELGQTAGDNLGLLADISAACSVVKDNCDAFAKLANKKLETLEMQTGDKKGGNAKTGNSNVEPVDQKMIKTLNIELGKLTELQKKYSKVLALLESARDKANKNKIENNDPLMLLSLAEAYRNTKNFSEHLEIYFEISKYYPAVRLSQDAVQGVYSVEQKSAGDVKIF